MASFTSSQNQHTVVVRASEIELAFSLEDGGLRMLRRVGGPNVLGYGEARPSIEVSLGAGSAWLADWVFVRYLSHAIDERDGGVEVMILLGIGPLKVYDRYRITGTLIARRISVENVSEDEVWLRGVRLVVPWVRTGALETCRFEAPANTVRPRLTLQIAAAQRREVLPRRFFAPGLRNGRAMAPAPTQGPGLMAIHDTATDETLLCWYHGAVEAALPQVEGNDTAATLLHEIGLADRMGGGVALSGGTQYIMLLREPWHTALAAFQRTWPICGLRPLPDRAAWVRDAALYETHAAQFGGFRGLAAALPELRALGLNTLCLMPIWAFANRKGRLWDGNWEGSGDPYAIRDFEALDSTLGDGSDLRALVDSAHALGMRVLIDLPLSGCADDAPYVAAHPDWFSYDEQGEISRVAPQSQILAFDWANRALHEHMLAWAIGWARDYDFDGYRIAGREGQPNWARRLPYHAGASSLGALRLLHDLRDALRRIKPDAALLGEMGGPIFEEIHDATLAETPHHMFVHMAMNRVTPAELGEWLEDRARTMPPGVARICFTENHHTRVANPLADALHGSRVSRMLLAGMAFCGFAPLIWSGQERGDERFVGQILRLWTAHPVLRYGSAHYNTAVCDSAQVFSVLRADADSHLLGVLNVGPHKRTIELRLPIEQLGLPEGEYALHELCTEREWDEEGRRRWRRDDLLALNLTLDPFGSYCFVVRPAGEQQDAQPHTNADRADDAGLAPPDAPAESGELEPAVALAEAVGAADPPVRQRARRGRASAR